MKMATEQNSIHPKLIPYRYAKKQGVLISEILPEKVIITYHGHPSTLIFNEIKRLLNRPLQFKKTAQENFQALLAQVYEAGSGVAAEVILGMEESMKVSELMKSLPKAQDLLESENDAPIIRLINAFLTEAIKQSASDIHVEVFEENLNIRYRIDGVLSEVLSPPKVLAPLIISRIKVMAKLDIAEKRLPQDGRITLHIAGRTVDVRVSTIPTHYGERIVMRLLDKQTAKLNLSHLGMPSDALETLNKLIHQPHGIFLVTGPTGSGKTTSLYAALTDLNSTQRNILTVEDPIEYDLPGIGQMQVNTKVDMTFARSLRAILRQDPDVVMIGEIRDLETAEIAVQASLTGHLVLSTLHTNNAIGAITRLKDVGVDSYLIASTLIGVAAQRLIRLLCPKCKEVYTASTQEAKLLKLSSKKPKLYKPKGCKHCHQTGYTGRTGIYEIIPIDTELRNMIHDHVSEIKMENHAHQKHRSIRKEGCLKVLNGETSLEEVLRVTMEEFAAD
jgi:general secretion pathway protein E